MRKGDICVVDIPIEVGNEQYGARPAILISGAKTNIIIIIPLTTNLKALRFPHTLMILPNEQNNLESESVALVFHIRAIDKTRIIKIIGKLSNNSQEKIDNILREMLKL